MHLWCAKIHKNQKNQSSYLQIFMRLLIFFSKNIKILEEKSVKKFENKKNVIWYMIYILFLKFFKNFHLEKKINPCEIYIYGVIRYQKKSKSHKMCENQKNQSFNFSAKFSKKYL